MATLTVRAHGPVPADEAWDRYARPARWSFWSPQITRVSYPDERLSAGGSGREAGGTPHALHVTAEATFARDDGARAALRLERKVEILERLLGRHRVDPCRQLGRHPVLLVDRLAEYLTMLEFQARLDFLFELVDFLAECSALAFGNGA